MPRKKKSRKVGLIGVRSVPKEDRVRKIKPERVKKHKGKPAGSRHSAVEKPTTAAGNTLKKDPRTGSKKPVPLVATSPVKQSPATAKKKYFSPAQELAAIEADERLESLLDQLDQGLSISVERQQYVNEKMQRHQVLCELLGINSDEDGNTEDNKEQDLISKLENADLNKYSR
ncbi:Der GTPase-activating protein YihI [Neptunicella marina]|uniref:Der GTPase-activating protein YihI n=1 Tax=Neptunicella marina TaxID=2125989 RepID=A0A8J6ISG8_9ALTE|nr:Der GTPase-activating protein YihI [Neptunicella marina]MBC3766630.1 GTPase-activating protein [Neptunicella marina]